VQDIVLKMRKGAIAHSKHLAPLEAQRIEFRWVGDPEFRVADNQVYVRARFLFG
jgi:hypothetical protein